MTTKAVEEQQTLKRERYESRCAVKKRRYLWCNNATLPAQGGHGWCKNATLPVRGLNYISTPFSRVKSFFSNLSKLYGDILNYLF